MMPKYINNIRYITPKEVTDQLGISRQTLWRWRKASLIPQGSKFRGTQVVFSDEDYEKIRSYALRVSPIEQVDSIQLNLNLGLDDRHRVSGR